MKRIRILTVGQLKTSHWREAAAHYRKRLSRSLDLEEASVKDADAKLTLAQRKDQEGQRLLRQVRPQDAVLCLDEGGTNLSSPELAGLLRKLHDNGKTPCFIVGGAYGLSAEVLEAAQHVISFGRMTFTHELALVVLLEQIYRSENILAGTGYHH